LLNQGKAPGKATANKSQAVKMTTDKGDKRDKETERELGKSLDGRRMKN
jgi:hypothetical protein